MTGELKDLSVKVLEVFRRRGLTLATAESLTGGSVAAALVNTAGASDYFRGGVVTYATDLKAELLGVDAEMLATGGPVQAPVAIQMARGVARLCGCDVGVSTTGVAGPGSTVDGPAGRVFVGVSFGEAFDVREFSFVGDRDEVRFMAVKAALEAAVYVVSREQESTANDLVVG